MGSSFGTKIRGYVAVDIVNTIPTKPISKVITILVVEWAIDRRAFGSEPTDPPVGPTVCGMPVQPPSSERTGVMSKDVDRPIRRFRWRLRRYDRRRGHRPALRVAMEAYLMIAPLSRRERSRAGPRSWGGCSPEAWHLHWVSVA